MSNQRNQAADAARRLAQSRLSRRSLAKGLAAAPMAAGAARIGVSPARAQDETSIRFWFHTHPPMVEKNEAMIASFMEANPGITVEHEVIPNMEFGTKMLTSMGTGTGPDIINMDDSQMRSIYIPRGLVQEVDPVAMGYESLEALQANYIDGAFEGATVDGAIYGVPSEFNVTAFIINTAAFEEAGLDPNSPPTTWEEVGQMGQELVIPGERRGFDFLYLHQSWYHNQLGTLMLQTGGRYVAEDGTTVTVNSPEVVQALQIWYDMVYEYEIADPNIATREATVPYQDFLDGKVAMSLFNPWGMGFFAEERPIGDNWAIVPLPQVDPANPVNPLYAYYWSINAQTTDEARKEAASKLIAHLASDPGAWLTDVDFIQPVQGWSEAEAAAEFQFGEVWGAEMENGRFQPVIPNAEQVQQIMQQTIESSILTGVPPQEALDAAVPLIEAAIAE